jgi:hypothetical protein
VNSNVDRGVIRILVVRLRGTSFPKSVLQRTHPEKSISNFNHFVLSSKKGSIVRKHFPGSLCVKTKALIRFMYYPSEVELIAFEAEPAELTPLLGR